ncbi:hypothetical protein ACFFX1_43870 [Dactylosporangium sucinum]|uniref:Uncharacterized protein n=1 Tax=Dactylosporangium sucinum TaxID=1424081 RepID=A0A917X5G6_9ACTN|nr:hypothetical protein [Dactylosporangium sucinum]GGM67053.1 hypothetical protein GCM10007977_080900 [Dactylosporangium sucinum]
MRMTSEPPAGYVAFVTRHLEPLRRDATRVAGAPEDADALYGDVLTDVATRWTWLELQRTRLGQADAADEFLGRVFARRSERFYLDETTPADDGLEITVTPELPPEASPPRRVYVSNAVRLAPIVIPRKARNPAFIAGPVCEAAIAWWHAYENIRRRRLVYAGFVLITLLLTLANVTAPPVEP